MECNTREEINKILARVNSINDLDPDTVAELRGTLAGRFSIETFSVDTWDWQAWSEKYQEIRGIEYDAQNSRIRIKATGSPLHEAATGAISEWLMTVRELLNTATGRKFVTAGSAGVLLSDDYEGSEKAPDASLSEIDKEFPLIVVEVAVGESSKKVFEDATRWLKGTKGCTKLVIVVDIKEKITGDTLQRKTDWGLSKDELCQIGIADLAKHILQWHRDNESPLVGSFEAYFHICLQNQPPRQVWKCEFSMDDLESTCFPCGYITANELIPELDETCRIPLPLQELSTNIRDSLIRHELKRACMKAKRKVKEMRKTAGQEQDRA